MVAKFFANCQFQGRSTSFAYDIEKQKFPVELMLTDKKRITCQNSDLKVRTVRYLTLSQLKVVGNKHKLFPLSVSSGKESRVQCERKKYL